MSAPRAHKLSVRSHRYQNARAEWSKMMDCESDADDANASTDSAATTAGCGHCLHPSFCMCSFTSVTPGCLGSAHVEESDEDDDGDDDDGVDGAVEMSVVVAAVAAGGGGGGD